MEEKVPKVKVDFNNFKTFIDDFDSCVQRYNQACDSFFKTIKQYKGWEGDAATKYLDNVGIESNKFINFGESLQTYSKTLSDINSNLIETINVTARK